MGPIHHSQLSGWWGRCAVWTVVFPLALAAQDPPVVFRTEVNLVRLLTTVRDPAGRLVGGLQREDFTVYDNGVRQEIAVFERTTAQPLSVALLMDTSASIAKELRVAVLSVKRFLNGLLKEGNPRDEIALFTFNHAVQQHTSFTRNISLIEQRVKPLRAESGTSLYDAIHLVARELERRDGRHVIVVVTDGGDTTSYYTYQDALEAAHRADAPIYSLLLTPITNEAGRNVGGENALKTLGESTGGRLFLTSVGAEMDQALENILRELRTQYLLGYYPRGIPRSSSRFHTVRVELSQPGLRAVTRTGYFRAVE
ncbi:MAG: VWA domain-containing protein [Bryobacteraceae bacterium]|nr:VWA domain-containing protein [Bryobacteraceae bacterium]MDW8377173.1 VWA domain-containing protein [Bryobacterales bacterium]